jgi:menaquinone-dependent protoporphyrinogen IX oxidase
MNTYMSKGLFFKERTGKEESDHPRQRFVMPYPNRADIMAVANYKLNLNQYHWYDECRIYV